MKSGTIFDHPTKDGGVVRLMAVESYTCTGCVFNSSYPSCENQEIGMRDRNITDTCSDNAVIFVKARAGQVSHYAYCKKSYTNDPLKFDAGYMESISDGQRFFPNEHWRYATVEEVADFFSRPAFSRPKGRYLAE